MKTFNTERLTIRNFAESDGEDLYEYLSDPVVVKYEPHDPFTREAAYGEAKRRAGDEHFLAVCHGDKLIGNVYFAEAECGSWEVGYVFNKAYWGRGYASEAVRGVMKYGFENLGAHRVIAMCNPVNVHSWRLMERVGMRREAMFLKNIWFNKDTNGNPIWQDTYQYGILKDEFYAKH